MQGHARRAGLSFSAYVRALLDGHKPTSRPRFVEAKTVDQLKDAGNQLNKIAKRFNASAYSGKPPEPEELNDVLGELRPLLEAMHNKCEQALEDDPKWKADLLAIERRIR